MWYYGSVGATDKPPVEAKTIGLALAFFSFPVVMGALIWIYPAAGRAAHALGLAEGFCRPPADRSPRRARLH